ncbi:hypothetical protein ES703_78760 [subsurface metagenome]
MVQQILPSQLTVSLIRGSISWNLPESLQFTPGDTITITLTITNPTEERRIYGLPWALIRSGVIVSVGLVSVDDTSAWWIDGGESEEISFELSPEITDAYFNISLLAGITLEEEELEMVEEIIDSLTVYLYSTAAPTVQPLEVQALWVSQAISILTTIAMLAYFGAEMLKGITRVIKKES